MVPEITPAEAKAWRERESKRLTDGTYTPLPDNWRHAYWFTDSNARRVRNPDTGLLEHQPKYPDHFAHISVDRVSMIAFTENDQKGVRDRQTRISPGKYLAKFFGDYLTKLDIQGLATQMGAEYNDDADLLFATTADEFEEIYTTGPSSCMSHGVSHFSSNVHPVRVYAGFDLQLAYLKRQGRVTARALCWPEKKIYGRLYGDSVRLGTMLGKEGYHEGSLNEARITKLMQGGSYVIPFLDYLEGAVDCGEHLQLFAERQRGQQFCCTGGQQNGLSEDDERVSCEACGDAGNEDDMYWVEGNESWYCSHCYSERYTQCDNTGETVHRDEIDEVRVRRRAAGSWVVRQWGEYARENDAFWCDVDEVFYSSNDVDQHEVNGETWGPDAWERYGIMIDGVATDKRTLPGDELSGVQPMPQAPVGEIVVGCTVVCTVQCSDPGFRVGALYKVKSLDTAYGRVYVTVERDSVGCTNGWGIEHFRFHSMPEAPVQTGLHIRDELETSPYGMRWALYDGAQRLNAWNRRDNAEAVMLSLCAEPQPEEVAI